LSRRRKVHAHTKENKRNCFHKYRNEHRAAVATNYHFYFRPNISVVVRTSVLYANVKRLLPTHKKERCELPKNGEINNKFGLYRSLCCGYEVVVAERAKFPDCPNHLNLPTIWKSVVDDPNRIPHIREILAQERIHSTSERPHVFLDRRMT
jgi:hypothetical protein